MQHDPFDCVVVHDGDAAVVRVRPGQRVLHEMIRAGTRPIEVGCRGGGCGVCRVRVLEGTFSTKRMSRKHVSESDEAAGIALACRLIPTSPLVIAPVPPSGTDRP